MGCTLRLHIVGIYGLPRTTGVSGAAGLSDRSLHVLPERERRPFHSNGHTAASMVVHIHRFSSATQPFLTPTQSSHTCSVNPDIVTNLQQPRRRVVQFPIVHTARSTLPPSLLQTLFSSIAPFQTQATTGQFHLFHFPAVLQFIRPFVPQLTLSSKRSAQFWLGSPCHPD